MDKKMMFKLGQVAGALFMAAGVAACQMREHGAMPTLFLIGGLLYGGCRLTAWLTDKK